MNDDTTAKLLLQPIQAGLFESLYQQGWRADQLFRLMVDRIEYRDPTDRIPKTWQVIHNKATRDNLFDYTRFLRVSALAYELQRRGWLVLRGKAKFVPLTTLAGLAAPTPPGPKLADVLDTLAKNPNLTWRQVSGQWEFDQEIITSAFELNDPFDENITDCKPEPPNPSETQLQCYIEQEMPELRLKGAGLAGATLLSLMLKILQNGFTIEENADTGESADNTDNQTADDKDNAKLEAGQFFNRLKSSLDDKGISYQAISMPDDTHILVQLATDRDQNDEFRVLLAPSFLDWDVAPVPSKTSSYVLTMKSETVAASCHLVMRSMIGLMSAAAQEQDGFDKLMRDERIIIPVGALSAALDPVLAAALDPTRAAALDPKLKVVLQYLMPAAGSTAPHPPTFKDAVPTVEQHPILQLTWEPEDGPTLLPLIEITYGNSKNNTFMVTDKVEPTNLPPGADPTDLTWNRDLFRLISQITAQVTVDISKFPLPQILQLHTD